MAFQMKLKSGKSKQFGLVLSSNGDKKAKTKTSASVFAQSEDDQKHSNNADSIAETRRRVAEEAAKSFSQEQALKAQQQALAEDPSVYDYDGVYDEMQKTRASKAAERKEKRDAEKQKPQYIATLVEKAKIREIEHERMRERKLLKERKAEDALYGDKEKLISASYKRKLMEMKRWDAEDARLDAKEAEEDVTKQGSEAMAGFYSNLITKNLAMGGQASNSRSAYTAGKASDSEGASAVSAVAARSYEHRHDSMNDVEVPESKRPKTDFDATTASDEQPKQSITERSKPDQPKEKPKENKEEVISAARARFLARKAQRQTPTS